MLSAEFVCDATSAISHLIGDFDVVPDAISSSAAILNEEVAAWAEAGADGRDTIEIMLAANNLHERLNQVFGADLPEELVGAFDLSRALAEQTEIALPELHAGPAFGM
ncbi:conserved hypothetical protein [Hyphomicrobiales bacterium]|nr:conserved hypothetical protein [Hyphomicrobiales bacterium]CAH1702808.1 hypothetical protein BOSEA1005_30680 [Hyphomicrobiales bacterium]CAI0346997.1 conserved hypothetical protein [Hyphomicrobiales bacterium]